MTRQTTPENTPGHAVYVGMQGNHPLAPPAVRVYHVTSGPNLPPPVPYERLLSAAPDLLAALETVVESIGWLADANSPNSNIGKAVCPAVAIARAAIRKATGQG